MGVNVGSLADPPDMQGMAHAVEHTLFMGTEKVRAREWGKGWMKGKEAGWPGAIIARIGGLTRASIVSRGERLQRLPCPV